LLKKTEGERIFNTVKIFRANFAFQGKRKVAQKSWMVKNISIQWKISGQLCFSGKARVTQKSWMQNVYSIHWKFSGQLCFSAQAQSCWKILNG